MSASQPSLLALVALALGLEGGCASVSGLDTYEQAHCPGDLCQDGGATSSGTFDAMSDATIGPDGADSPDGSPLSNGDGSLFDSPATPDAAEAGLCDGSPCSGEWACAVGGCNQPGGSCAGPETCACTSDAQCKSGKCVPASGRNDVACGSSCTGSGAADGFQCALGSPGIPSACTATFAYTPANLTATQLAALAPVAPVTLSCAGTVTFDGSHWTGATCGQTLPAPHTVTQTSGPTIDVLAFQGLTVAAGVTLNLTGTNAVMIVVFGDASVAGDVHADGADGASNTANPGASGPGGDSGCGSSVGGAGGSGHTGGGGGGGGQTAGGVGAGGVGGTGGAAGSGLAGSGTVPLRGGCPGGTSGSWACTTSGGGGGGAIEIAVAGTLTVGGIISANGGAGGTANCASAGCAPGPNHTYGGGGGGGGSGGTVYLLGATVDLTGSLAANGGAGGNPDSALQEMGAGGAGATSSTQPGAPGTGSVSNGCGSDDESGGGGGGGYGFVTTTSGQPADYACTTTLSPAPACNAAHDACECVDDSNCASGKCVDGGQCTGTCTGVAPGDVTGCAAPSATSVATP